MLPRRILLVRVCTLLIWGFLFCLFVCLIGFCFPSKNIEERLIQHTSCFTPAFLGYKLHLFFFFFSKHRVKGKTFTSFTHLEPFRLSFRTEALTEPHSVGLSGTQSRSISDDRCLSGEWSSKERKPVGQILFKFKLGLGGLSTVAATLADNQPRYLLYSKDVIGRRSVKNYWYTSGDWRWQLND